MANVEGAVRMMRVGKCFVLGGTVFLALGALGVVCGQRFVFRPFTNPAQAMLVPASLGVLVYLGFLPEAFGIALWVSGWIVEGFLTSAERQ